MQPRRIQFQRQLIVAFLALVQLFAPLVHAHTGDSRLSGVHVHTPAADQAGGGPVLTVDPGTEIGIASMRRESGGIVPASDLPSLILSLPDEPAFSVRSLPPPVPAAHVAPSRYCDSHPLRGPPTSTSC